MPLDNLRTIREKEQVNSIVEFTSQHSAVFTHDHIVRMLAKLDAQAFYHRKRIEELEAEVERLKKGAANGR